MASGQTLQGQEQHKIVPFTVLAALRNKLQIVNRGSNGHLSTAGDQAAHRQAGFDAPTSVLQHRGYIVRHKDAMEFGGPGKDSRIICAGKPDVLNASNVEPAVAPDQPTDDAIIEIFVSRQGNHRDLASLTAPQETIANLTIRFARRKRRLGADLLLLSSATIEIRLQLIAMSQIVADD